jgi:hypothetical protein
MWNLKKYKLILKIVWSNNILLPKMSLFVLEKRSIGLTNKFKNYTYRFYPTIVKK